MYYDDYYDEPSEFERQVEEFKESLVEVVKNEHKAEMLRLREENARLSTIEREMEDKTASLRKELREIEWRKKNLKLEVEKEFYAANLDDVLSDSVEKCIVWFAFSVGHEKEKCTLCDDERTQTAVYPNGDELKRKCECASLIYRYEPGTAELTVLTVRKRDSIYQSDRAFYISKKYKPDKESRKRCDDYELREFSIQYIVETFTEETKSLHENLSYGGRVGFTSKSECQKYCDWLNSKNSKQGKV